MAQMASKLGFTLCALYVSQSSSACSPGFYYDEVGQVKLGVACVDSIYQSLTYISAVLSMLLLLKYFCNVDIVMLINKEFSG